MPFNYEEYSAKCENMTVEELQQEWQNYTRHTAGGATSTALSVCFAPITLGASLLGLGISAPRIHNARKKRAIIEAHFQAHHTSHHTRKRDVLGPMAISTTINGLTLGFAPAGADAAASVGLEYGIAAIAAHPMTAEVGAHAVLDGVGTAAEHKHTEHKHKKVVNKQLAEKLRRQVALQEKALREMGRQEGMSSQGSSDVEAPPQAYSPGEKDKRGMSDGDMSDEDNVDIAEIEALLVQLKAGEQVTVSVKEVRD